MSGAPGGLRKHRYLPSGSHFGATLGVRSPFGVPSEPLRSPLEPPEPLRVRFGAPLWESGTPSEPHSEPLRSPFGAPSEPLRSPLEPPEPLLWESGAPSEPLRSPLELPELLQMRFGAPGSLRKHRYLPSESHFGTTLGGRRPFGAPSEPLRSPSGSASESLGSPFGVASEPHSESLRSFRNSLGAASEPLRSRKLIWKTRETWKKYRVSGRLQTLSKNFERWCGRLGKTLKNQQNPGRTDTASKTIGKRVPW